MVANLVELVKRERLDFKELENLLFKSSLLFFRDLMREVLELLDKDLMENRDKKRYENKETNERTIQTLVGEIPFTRRYYRDRDEKRWVYLLDEMLEIDKEKNVSPGLLKLGVTWAIKGPSYRDARDRLTDLYGARVLSHETIRQALLEVGAACDRELENKIIKKEGEKEVKALFIEVDGFGARLQRNRRRKRQNRRREAKMAIIHEGWARRANSEGSDYCLVNPHYISNLDECDDFWEHIRGFLNAHYKDIDNTLVVINGDGASWIREGINSFSRSMYQYNRFHIARKIRSALCLDRKRLCKAQKALRENDVGTLLYTVTEAWSNCTDETQREKLAKLKDTLFENREYITDYRIRLKEKGLEVPKSWRGLGAAESNVNKFKNRTGKRGRAWSREGLTAILTTLSRLFSGNLEESLSRTLQEKEEWHLEQVTSGAGHITSNSQGDFTGVKAGSFPAIKHGTQGFSKLFRQISAVQFE